jgi:F0F1-type ATP synthase assembly protein I
VGFGAGALLGAGLGELAWDTDEGRWAGAIVGSAVGMIAGFWIGARRGWDVDESGPDQPPAALSFHVPVSLGR